MVNVGSWVLKTNAGMMCIVTERRGEIPHPVLRAKRVIFKIFIINTIKFRPLFWFFFSLSEYTRTFIIKCSSSILQRTRHKSQETMENVNKAERIVEYFFVFFFKFFFLNLSFCSFIFFWYRSQVFLGRKIKLRRQGGQGKIREKRQLANKKTLPQQKKKSKEGATWQNYCTGVNSTPGGGVREKRRVWWRVTRWASLWASFTSQGKSAAGKTGYSHFHQKMKESWGTFWYLYDWPNKNSQGTVFPEARSFHTHPSAVSVLIPPLIQKGLVATMSDVIMGEEGEGKQRRVMSWAGTTQWGVSISANYCRERNCLCKGGTTLISFISLKWWSFKPNLQSVSKRTLLCLLSTLPQVKGIQSYHMPLWVVSIDPCHSDQVLPWFESL